MFFFDKKNASVAFHSLPKPIEFELELIARETCFSVTARLRWESLWIDEPYEEDLFLSKDENPLRNLIRLASQVGSNSAKRRDIACIG